MLGKHRVGFSCTRAIVLVEGILVVVFRKCAGQHSRRDRALKGPVEDVFGQSDKFDKDGRDLCICEM